MSFYEDASLVFLAAGAAGKDGKVYNLKPSGNITTKNLVDNGAFDSSTNWVADAGWTIEDGKAGTTGSQISSIDLVQTTTYANLAEGRSYKLEYTVSNYVAGTLSAFVRGTAAGTASADGTYTEYATAGSDTDAIKFTADSSFRGKIDDVSIVEVEAIPADFTFARGTDLTATRVGKDGYIEKGRENLLLQSNQFDTTWTLNSASLTSGQAGYDGSNDAWELKATGDGVTNLARLNQGSLSVSGVSTFSVYAKAGNVDWIRLNALTSGTNVNNYFDLSGNGAVGASPSNTVVESKIESIGSNWFRISVTSKGEASISEVRIQVAEADGDEIPATNSYVYIQDAQLEQGLVATDYIETDASTAKAGLLEDEPRFDYTGGGCPALLIEGDAINLLEHSEYAGPYTTSGTGTVTDNHSTSPEGILNAFQLNDTSASAYFRIEDDVTVSAGNVGDHTLSVFIKKTTGSLSHYAGVQLDSTRQYVIVDTTNGTANQHLGTANDSFSVEDFSDDYWRVSITNDLASAADYRVALWPAISENGTTISTAATGSNVFYGIQLEKGSYATSYIPTYGSSATRTYDDPNELVHGITMGTSCSFFLEATNFKVTETGGPQTSFLKLRAATSPSEADRFLFLGVANAARTTFTLQAQNKESGTSTTTTLDKTGLTMGSPFKALARYDGTSFDLFVNGVLEGSETIVADDHFGRVELKNLTSQAQNGHSISQVILFDSALSTSDSEILTGATSYNSFADMATTLNYTIYE